MGRFEINFISTRFIFDHRFFNKRFRLHKFICPAHQRDVEKTDAPIDAYILEREQQQGTAFQALNLLSSIRYTRANKTFKITVVN